MVYELNGRENIYIIGNVIILQNDSKKRNSGKSQLAQSYKQVPKIKSG